MTSDKKKEKAVNEIIKKNNKFIKKKINESDFSPIEKEAYLLLNLRKKEKIHKWKKNL